MAFFWKTSHGLGATTLRELGMFRITRPSFSSCKGLRQGLIFPNDKIAFMLILHFWHLFWQFLCLEVTLVTWHCAPKQQVILREEAAQDWAIVKLPGSHGQPLLGKVKTAGQGYGFRASSEGSLEWQLKTWDSQRIVLVIESHAN